MSGKRIRTKKRKRNKKIVKLSIDNQLAIPNFYDTLSGRWDIEQLGWDDIELPQPIEKEVIIVRKYDTRNLKLVDLKIL